MRLIEHQIQTYLNKTARVRLCKSSVDEVRKDKGILVADYEQLVQRMAELAFANPEFVLLFRGQSRDYPDGSRKSTLLPEMFRLDPPGNPRYPIEERYEILTAKETELIEAYSKHEHRQRLGRSKILRWAILQHYRVCATPLLDVTHSLRIATSFAMLDLGDIKHEPYVYVLGLPQISGSITVVADQMLQIVRLSSVCPPTTLRPYFQEGYLIGTYPVLDNIGEKMRYQRPEVDCANRLVAKFRLRREGFHNDTRLLDKDSLYPRETNRITERIERLGDSA